MIKLREVEDSDREAFFGFMQDAGAIHMAAFTPEDSADRAAFDAHWARILSDDEVTMRTIVRGGEVVGNIGSFVMFGDREVTYWIDRGAWGSGVATEALAQFLDVDATRPIHARVAQDNAASIRVLEKSDFTVVGEDEGYAHGRGEVIVEYVMALES